MRQPEQAASTEKPTSSSPVRGPTPCGALGKTNHQNNLAGKNLGNPPLRGEQPTTLTTKRKASFFVILGIIQLTTDLSKAKAQAIAMYLEPS